MHDESDDKIVSTDVGQPTTSSVENTSEHPDRRLASPSLTVSAGLSYAEKAARRLQRDRERKHARIPATCLNCRKEFMALKDAVERKGMGRYCSVACSGAHAKATGKFVGAKNPHWLGGVSNDNMRYRTRQIERHPMQEAARRAVREAVRSGAIVRQPCERCGAAKAQGHHDDYSKPLEVRWLCRKHHDEHHRLMGDKRSGPPSRAGSARRERTTMKNLAGNPECDAFIEHELKRAGIAIELVDLPKHSEVPYRMIGRLGPIEFRRAWRYWVAKGPVSIETARRLYEDPIGRTDIRVDGHCGCPAPVAPWTEIIDGREFVMAYHIDSEVGLRVFADAVRALAAEAA